MSGSNKHNKGNATASFSGFLYQADIALWKSVEKIININNDSEIEDKKEELTKWSLEVEGEEDFTLYRVENGVEDRRESYQVKETNKTNSSGYTEAVIKLFQEQQNSGNRKSILVTEKKIEIETDKYVDFLDGLYSSRSLTGLTEAKEKLNYLFKGINNEQTFLSEKINYCETNEKLKFIDGETQETIKNFVKEKTKDFFDKNFEYIFGDNKDKVHEKINNLLSILSNETNSKYHFRYLESKIKRFIQEKKNNQDYPNIELSEIFKIIKKPGEDIIKEILNSCFYQDIFINHFIERFKYKFFKIYPGCIWLDGNIEDIFKELGNENYIIFLDNLIGIISENILSKSSTKVFTFIKNTIGDKLVDDIEYKNSIEDFNDFNDKISSFDDRIYLKIKMIAGYFYSKVNNYDLQDNIDCNESNNLEIQNKQYRGIMTGLLDTKPYLKEFLKAKIFYEFEKTHIGIYGVDKYLYEHLGEDKEEKGFIESLDKSDKDKYEKIKKWGITQTKEIKIFSGKNCLREDGDKNAKNFMN